MIFKHSSEIFIRFGTRIRPIEFNFTPHNATIDRTRNTVYILINTGVQESNLFPTVLLFRFDLKLRTATPVSTTNLLISDFEFGCSWIVHTARSLLRQHEKSSVLRSKRTSFYILIYYLYKRQREETLSFLISANARLWYKAKCILCD